MKKNLQICFAAGLTFFYFNITAYADEKDLKLKDLKLKDAKFVIEKDIAISLPEEQQIFTNINFLEKNSITLPVLDYNFDELDIDLGLLAPDFKILKAKQEILEKLHTSYLKIGHGICCDPILEFGYGNTYDSTINYGAILKHSSLGAIKNGYFSDISLSAGHIYFSKFIKSLLIGADAKYRYDKFCFLTDGPQARYISSFDFLTHIKNYELSNLRYIVDLNYYNTTITDKNFGEHQVFATGRASYTLSETRKLIGDIKIFISKYTNEEKSINRNCFETKVIDRFKLWNFRIHYGAVVNLDDDGFGKTVFLDTICPVLGFRYDFRPWMKPYLNIIDKANNINSLRSVLGENPYVKGNFILHNEYGTKLGNLGLMGEITDEVSYNSGLAFYLYNRALFYENSKTTDENSSKEQIYGCEFEGKYNANTYCKFYAEFLYNSIDDKWRSSFEISYLASMVSFTLNPSLECKVVTTYKLNEKWLLTKKMYLLSGHAYFEKRRNERSDGDIGKEGAPRPKKIFIEPIVDISVGVDYFLTPRFVIFAALNNILMRSNLRFYNTRAKTIYFTAGITYSFL